ncbi:MAG TPA: glycoside hydrolase domain-containing protein, partial [Anaerolineales bacterium]|nr:glycoside hydrolase domain-containing protein [Anaerolineales bacterium]
WTTPDPGGGASVSLSQTADRGRSWRSRALSLFEPGEVASNVEKVEMGWFDLQRGWISAKQMSGSNFSLGVLFTTSDGGESWSRFELPVADELYFSDPQTGWAVGGPTEAEIFLTQDGGVTWSDVRPPDMGDVAKAIAYEPFASGGQGLFLATTLGAENHLQVYSLESTFEWSLFEQVRLDAPPGRIAISILDPENFVATIPGTGSIVRMTKGIVEVLQNEDGLSASIVGLDMISLDIGWARSVDSSCANVAPMEECYSSTRLLQTADGGITWQALPLPSVPAKSISAVDANPPAAILPGDKAESGNTEVYIGQGFDRCEIPSLSQMQTWWDASPYRAVNLYIGGSSRACANSVLTPSFLSHLYRQGWKFIPTWVGPQAPCTGYPSRMSYDVTAAFGQGVTEADLAVDRLFALGLTDPDKTGSVVYYDIEPYGTDTTCRAAVNAFMNGWVSQLRARGNLAGVYGSTLCDTALSDFRDITYVPDVIWPARWYHNIGAGYYDHTANVWNLGSCIPNTAWSNHQRIRQYEGDHDELWGGLVLDIDSNVLDGVVAIPDTDPVEVKIADTTRGSYKLVPHQITHQSYINVDSGPIQIVSPDNVPLIASERVIYRVDGANTSFTEIMGLPDRQLDITYWLPWYNNIGLDSQLRFANVSNTTAMVHVYIGGEEMQGSPFTLGVGQSTRRSFPDIDNGPVKIVSNVPIVAAERLIYKVSGVPTSFSEIMALPDSQLDTIYWLPWYNNIGLDTQLRFANVSSTKARVRIFIGNEEMQESPFTLGVGESTRKSFPGIDGGPVKIVSDQDIVVAERVIYRVNGAEASFTEMMALPDSQIDTTYWLPWYDNKSVDSQLRFANISNSMATVRVFIGDAEMQESPFTLDVGESMRRGFPGIDDGPVKIVSNVPIVAAERLIYKFNNIPTSFSEMMALPDSQLDTAYWLPWYNNIGLNTQLRFGIP